VGDDPEAVIENRRRAAAAVGLGLDDLVFCQQSHGRVVVSVTAADRGRGAYSAESALPGADALVTAEPDVGLVVMVADCVPIVLFDPRTVTVACVHAGWRGTVARVVDAAINALVDGGSRPADLLVGVGPAVPAERYQVGPEVADAAVDAFGDAAGELLTPDSDGRWRFDLWAANQRVLAEAGVPEENVAVARMPTGPDGPFFSDRSVRPCGRFAAVTRLRR
jgi:YfiH family protein